MTMTLKQMLLFMIGCVSVALGAAGIVLPVLPTTPFVILAAVCFAGSSPRTHAWLASSRYFGEFVRSYTEGTGVSTSSKLLALLFLWPLLALSIYLMRGNLAVVALLLVIGVCVTAHIILLKGRPDAAPEDD